MLPANAVYMQVNNARANVRDYIIDYFTKIKSQT